MPPQPPTEDTDTVSDNSNQAKTATRVMDLSAMELIPGCYCPECGARLGPVPASGAPFKCGDCTAVVVVVAAQLVVTAITTERPLIHLPGSGGGRAH